MKKLLGILVLNLLFISTPSYADDIQDFQIEGMSIGDSLLDYFSKDEIENRIITYYFKKKFGVILFEDKRFEVYEAIQIHYKPKDEKYIIYGIDGNLYFTNNMEECYKKKIEIVKELNAIFKDAKIINKKKSHEADKTGDSKHDITGFRFNKGGYIAVDCTDWSTKLNSEGWTDELKVAIISKIFDNFINNEAYE